MPVAVRNLTWDDLKDLPEDAGRTEIVDGDLVVSPTLSDRHQEISTALAAKIYSFVKRRKLGKFYGARSTWCSPSTSISSPTFVFSRRRVSTGSNRPSSAGPPDLIIEIISEVNRTHDTVVKFQN